MYFLKANGISYLSFIKLFRTVIFRETLKYLGSIFLLPMQVISIHNLV